MRVPISWLTQYCDAGLEPEALAERLSMTGTEVERVSTLGTDSTDGFVIGRVLSAEQHPNADRLRVCMVETGEGAPVQSGRLGVRLISITASSSPAHFA